MSGSASLNLSAEAPPFVPSSPDPEEQPQAAPTSEEVMVELERATDHFHEEMFKPFNGNFRNLTLFFPDGLATFDDQERWFVHPWFWSDFVQDDPWYSTVDWRQYQQYKPLKYACSLLSPDMNLFFSGGLTEKLQPSDRCIRARVRSEWGRRTETIMPIANMAVGRYLHCMVLLNNQLLVIGGQRKEDTRYVFLDSCEILQGDSWQPAPSLTTARSTFCTAVHNNTVYAFGGFSDCGVLSTGIEKLLAGGAGWELVPVSIPMLAGMSTTYSQNVFWLIGGSDGESQSDRILAFNPSTETTTVLENDGEAVKLTVPRAKALTFAAVGNRVFVFGGGVEDGEKFKNLKSEPLEYGAPPRMKEDWLLACPFALKSA